MPSVTEAIKTDQAIKKSREGRNRRLRLGISPEQVEHTESAFDALELKGKERRGIDKALVSHRSDPIIIMYDAEGNQRQVPEGSVRVCLAEGLFLECPLCGDEHKSNDINACPSRPKLTFRRCPVCAKKISDDRASAEALASEEEGLIPTDLPGTPEARTKAKLEAHLVAYHEQAARRAGLMTADSARR